MATCLADLPILLCQMLSANKQKMILGEQIVKKLSHDSISD